jgi:predicted enzyme related to lactoylglutathione lyase
VLKASYWRWPDRDMAGNAIDFYTKVLGVSFTDAMRELTQK